MGVFLSMYKHHNTLSVHNMYTSEMGVFLSMYTNYNTLSVHNMNNGWVLNKKHLRGSTQAPIYAPICPYMPKILPLYAQDTDRCPIGLGQHILI